MLNCLFFVLSCICTSIRQEEDCRRSDAKLRDLEAKHAVKLEQHNVLVDQLTDQLAQSKAAHAAMKEEVSGFLCDDETLALWVRG